MFRLYRDALYVAVRLWNGLEDTPEGGKYYACNVEPQRVFFAARCNGSSEKVRCCVSVNVEYIPIIWFSVSANTTCSKEREWPGAMNADAIMLFE